MTNNKSFRVDSVKIPKVKKTKEGYLKGDVVVSKTGVFRYINSDGTERFELRHPDDIFKPASLESLQMIPVTRNHPTELVNAANSHKYQKGFTGENHQISDDKIIVSITVTDEALIKEIESGEREQLSAGYEVQLIKEDGEYKGQKYQYRQINPIYNHIATVDVARVGKEARFRFDAEYATSEMGAFEQKKLTTIGKDSMDNNEDLKLRLDAAEAISKQKDAELELTKVKLTQVQLKTDALEKALVAVKDELDAAKKKTEIAALNKIVLDRFEIFARASSAIDVPAYIQHSDREVMIAALKAKTKQDNSYEDCDDSYIKGRFDSVFGAVTQINSEKNVFKTLTHKINADNALDINTKLANAFKESWSEAKHSNGKR